MQRWFLVLAVGLFAALTVGCVAIDGAGVAEARVIELPIEYASSEPERSAQAAVTETGASRGLGDCPVTLPAGQPFKPSAPYPATYPYEGRSWYGTASLWLALPDDGRWSQLLYGDKVFWWYAGYLGSEEQQPELWMTARRLDGEGTVEQDPPATNAYHRDFHWAMLTGFAVPSAGCWEITGHYENETLTFVVWVE